MPDVVWVLALIVAGCGGLGVAIYCALMATVGSVVVGWDDSGRAVWRGCHCGRCAPYQPAASLTTTPPEPRRRSE